MTASETTGGAPTDGTRDELARARTHTGRSIRDLTHAFVGREHPAEVIDEIGRRLDDAVATLAAGTPRSRDPHSFGDHRRAAYPEGPFECTADDRPISGAASPLGLDPELRRVGDTIEARVTLRAAHEGAPGRSHGGVVAALFDDIFGFVLGVVGETAFTGRLTVTYRAGTPLHQPLVCRVWPLSRDGRKLLMAGTLHTDDDAPTLLAEADATFIIVDADRLIADAAHQNAPAPHHDATR
ncbi:MAG: PaaI family thioesterase [Actinomycetota bacterium]|nr:PaaI family thioesterase [Actinomycetota bacterium]MDA3006102.1 PaaI family thioesterase [Actinomycetota bacterium]MDA3033798.1 PaaI family thioesterase [Actinomycetota bacterium]